MDESPTEYDVINFEDAARRIPGGIDGVRQMAPELMQECNQQLEVVREGLAARDAQKVRLGAHTIKGSAAVFSAARVAKSALALEMIGREGNIDAGAAALVDLEAEVERLGQVLLSNSDGTQDSQS